MKLLVCLFMLGLSIVVSVPLANAQSGFQRPYLQSPRANSVAISEGNLRIYALSQEDSGLLRDVTIELAGDNSVLMSAKYARRTTSNQWILGDAVVHSFDADGNWQSEARASRFTVSAKAAVRAMPAQKLITEGGLQLSAARQDANGLLRDVLIKTALPQWKTDSSQPIFGGALSQRIFAKYARRDPKQAGRWILGNGVTYNFDLDGSLKSQTRYKKFWLSTQFDGEQKAPTTVLRFDATSQSTTQIFPRRNKVAPAAPTKPQGATPQKRGFQLLSG